ncbi:unnamed protein product [Closterium sp. Yama58-4]|nr:unnamed protein product [Closterium sp. Yama58-4]
MHVPAPHSLSLHLIHSPCTSFPLPAPHSLSLHLIHSPCTAFTLPAPHSLSLHLIPSPCTSFPLPAPHSLSLHLIPSPLLSYLPSPTIFARRHVLLPHDLTPCPTVFPAPHPSSLPHIPLPCPTSLLLRHIPLPCPAFSISAPSFPLFHTFLLSNHTGQWCTAAPMPCRGLHYKGQLNQPS